MNFVVGTAGADWLVSLSIRGGWCGYGAPLVVFAGIGAVVPTAPEPGDAGGSATGVCSRKRSAVPFFPPSRCARYVPSITNSYGVRSEEHTSELQSPLN